MKSRHKEVNDSSDHDGDGEDSDGDSDGDGDDPSDGDSDRDDQSDGDSDRDDQSDGDNDTGSGDLRVDIDESKTLFNSSSDEGLMSYNFPNEC